MGQRPGKRVKTRKLRHDDYLVDGPRAADRARDRPDPGPVRVRPGRRPPNGQTGASQSDRVERLNERVGRSQRPSEPTHLTACANRWPGAWAWFRRTDPQVLLNLAGNSIKVTQYGEVAVRVEVAETPGS